MLRGPMDERCNKCSHLCKRLDPEDSPVKYSFHHLGPQQVIGLVDDSIKRFVRLHHLQIEQSAHSTGDQLAVLLKVQYMSDTSENQIVLIAQAERVQDKQTDLWLRYGVPEDCCEQAAAPDFSIMMTEVLEQVEQCEWLLSKRRH
jgi:hypothetical protein